MRCADIIPSDRSMTRERWKALDRALRQSAPAIIAASMDVMLHGIGVVEVDAEGRAHYLSATTRHGIE